MSITIKEDRASRRGKELLKEAISEKKKRKAGNRSNYRAAASEMADSLCFKAKGRFINCAAEIKVKNIMSNEDRRARGWPQDPALPDYQEEN